MRCATVTLNFGPEGGVLLQVFSRWLLGGKGVALGNLNGPGWESGKIGVGC